MDAEVNARVVYLIRELRTLQDELSNPVADENTGLAVPKLSLETTQELKAVVDGLRPFLWAYLDRWSGNVSAQRKLQLIRIDAAADMLHHLHEDFRTSGIPKTPQTQRLCRQIAAMSDLASRGVAG